MPIVSDPNATYAYVLESDRDKPKNQQPTFMIKILTVRQWRAMSHSVTELTGGADSDKVFDAAIEIVAGGLNNWLRIKNREGQSVPFDVEAIDDIIGCEELMELAFAVINQMPSPETKKKSSSRSTSASDNAGRNRVGGCKRVKTRRAK